ncbi:MAG: Ig-like domain-containing protein [Bacteroidota bacterium]
MLKKGSFLGLISLVLIFLHAKAQEETDLVSFENKILEVRIVAKSQADSLSITKENSSTPILGTWTKSDRNDIFKPLIPLGAGKKYLVFRNGQKTDSIFLKRKKQAPPTVLAFYPSADTVPENLLKCYIRFSKPMRDQNIYSFLAVKDEAGKVVEDVFLPLKPALWNMDQTVLTLWIDPGRVKRDLIRSRNLGTPLKAGRTYQIKISSEWKALNGEKLPHDFRKSFFISERDEKIPNSSRWQINPPIANTSKSLSIIFSENMDYRTALEGIKIYKGDQLISGKPSLRNQERRWIFIPDSEWQTGNYIIKIEPTIEDNAGNNLIRPFDNDLGSDSNNSNNPLEISFSVN